MAELLTTHFAGYISDKDLENIDWKIKAFKDGLNDCELCVFAIPKKASGTNGEAIEHIEKYLQSIKP